MRRTCFLGVLAESDCSSNLVGGGLHCAKCEDVLYGPLQWGWQSPTGMASDIAVSGMPGIGGHKTELGGGRKTVRVLSSEGSEKKKKRMKKGLLH